MKFTLSTIVLLSLAIGICPAQTRKPIEDLNFYSGRMGVQYIEPPGFHEFVRTDHLFWPNKASTFLNNIHYKIKPDNADVILAISFFDFDKTGRIGPGSRIPENENSQIIKIRNLLGLSIKPEKPDGSFDMNLDTNKVKFFNEDELRKYGATYGGIAEIPMEKAYWNEYWKLRILFFFKKGKGEVYQYYFYNEGAPIDKTIRDSKYILEFKE